MEDRVASQLLTLIQEYQADYGPEDAEIADGSIKLSAVIQDLQESLGLEEF